MRHYIITALDGIQNPNIKDFNNTINYRAFKENKPYKMKPRTICLLDNHTVDFGDILFSPFPLFSEKAKKSLNLFLWEGEYKEIVFVDRVHSKSHLYYLPFFLRISGDVSWATNSMENYEKSMITLSESLPEDIPVIYLDTGIKLFLVARLDLIESLVRKGLCGVNMTPVNIQRGG